MSKKYKDREWLKEAYHNRGLTTREIADECECSNGTISRWLDNHDIETRENWKEGQKAATEVNRQEYITLRTLPAGYEYWASKELDGDGRTNRIVYVHRLLAVAEYGFDAVANNHVHHRDGVPWDNRPENVELLDRKEHGSIHANQRHHGVNPYNA